MKPATIASAVSASVGGRERERGVKEGCVEEEEVALSLSTLQQQQQQLQPLPHSHPGAPHILRIIARLALRLRLIVLLFFLALYSCTPSHPAHLSLLVPPSFA
jgi:hypothetical protein